MGPIKKLRVAVKAWRKKRQAQKSAKKNKERYNKIRTSVGMSKQ
jgi:hypothetical protein